MRLTIFLGLLLAVAGCKAETADVAAGLETGAHWSVSEIAGAAVPKEVSVTLEVPEPGVVAGSSGCNRYNGRFEGTGETIRFGALAGTRKMCIPKVMDVEMAFHSHIGRVTRIAMENGELVMFEGNTPVIRAIHP